MDKMDKIEADWIEDLVIPEEGEVEIFLQSSDTSAECISPLIYQFYSLLILEETLVLRQYSDNVFLN
jgi:hypothetical protein